MLRRVNAFEYERTNAAIVAAKGKKKIKMTQLFAGGVAQGIFSDATSDRVSRPSEI